MRTYGRVSNPSYASDPTQPKYLWVKVETDANGFNDMVYLVTLIQCFLLNLNESPFYASHGLPAKNSVVQQIAPDFYVALLQQRFAQYFASLTIAKEAGNPPTYRVNVTTHQGVKLNTSVEVPK